MKFLPQLAFHTSKLSSQFLTTFKNPDYKSKGGEPTFQQFTPKGLATAALYYNKKYPQRGEINPVFVVIDQKDYDEVEEAQKDEMGIASANVLVEKLAEKTANQTLEELTKLKDKAEQEGPQKLLLTSVIQNKEDARLCHSTPLVLTDKKMILMRDENGKFTQKMLVKSAKKLEVEIVQSRDPAYYAAKKQETSMQADITSCHFMALGILKDLTQEDLEKVATFEKGFEPLSKSLKYSQSTKYITNLLSEKSQEVPVKKDGRTVAQYIDDNKKYESDQRGSRIVNKFKQFAARLESAIEGFGGDEISPELMATKMLENQRAAEVGKESTSIKKASVRKFIDEQTVQR